MTPEQALDQEAYIYARAMKGVTPRGEMPPEVSFRLQQYRPRHREHYLCPRCHMNGRRNSLRAVPGTDEYDILRCNDDFCGADYIIPL